MQTRSPTPEADARTALMAWARAKGFAVREDHGWIILDTGETQADPLLKVMTDLLKAGS